MAYTKPKLPIQSYLDDFLHTRGGQHAVDLGVPCLVDYGPVAGDDEVRLTLPLGEGATAHHHRRTICKHMHIEDCAS